MYIVFCLVLCYLLSKFLYRKEIFSIVMSAVRYYCRYRDYRKIYCSKTFRYNINITVLLLSLLAKMVMIVSIILMIILYAKYS